MGNFKEVIFMKMNKKVLDVVEKAHKDEEGFHNMKLRVKNNLDNSEHVLYLPNLKKLQKKNA